MVFDVLEFSSTVTELVSVHTVRGIGQDHVERLRRMGGHPREAVGLDCNMVLDGERAAN